MKGVIGMNRFTLQEKMFPLLEISKRLEKQEEVIRVLKNIIGVYERDDKEMNIEQQLGLFLDFLHAFQVYAENKSDIELNKFVNEHTLLFMERNIVSYEDDQEVFTLLHHFQQGVLTKEECLHKILKRI